MNLYTIDFVMELGSKHSVMVQARNKVEAVSAAYSKVTGWRNKDAVVAINITEDAGNETSAENYREVVR